jgi:hypothetical protein
VQEEPWQDCACRGWTQTPGAEETETNFNPLYL